MYNPRMKRKAAAGDVFTTSILDALDANIAVIDEKGKIVFTNRAWDSFARENGASAGCCLGADYLQVCRKASEQGEPAAQEVLDGIRNVQHGRNTHFVTEYPCHSPEKKRWFDVHITRLEAPENYIILSHHDITERRLAQDHLRESEADYRFLFENSFAGISRTDLKGRILKLNQAYADMYGYESPDALMSEVGSVREFYVDQETRQEVLRALAEKGELKPREIAVKRRDGSVFTIFAAAREIRDLQGELTGYEAVGIDISEQILIRNALRESEDKLHFIFTQMKLGVVFVTAEGEFVEVNDAALAMFGEVRAEFLKMRLDDLSKVLVRDDGSVFQGAGHPVIQSLRGGVPVLNVKAAVRKRTGGDFTFQVLNAFPRYREDEALPYQVVLTLRDITQDKMFLSETQRMRENLSNLARHLLSAREEERKSLARDIHDEFGQVLSALKMDLKWLKKRLALSPMPGLEKIDDMISLTDKCMNAVYALTSQLRPAMLDDLGLTAAIESLAQDFRGRYGIDCELKINIDETRIGEVPSITTFRILQEALLNIAKHAQAANAAVSVRDNGRMLEIEVSDDGSGIAIERISDPRSYGLSGMRERVEALEGSFSVTGRAGRGSVLRAVIPLSAEGRVP